MNKKIRLLDCTLRDGSYINGSKFGSNTMKGIIRRLKEAKLDIIECGWLKDAPYEDGTTYFHVPTDAIPFIGDKGTDTTFVAMIDYNRYDVVKLPYCDNQSIDAIRVVFPRGQVSAGMALANPIREKGYKLYYQAANTLGYSDRELLDLIDQINEVRPEAVSIVDTFGAMYPEDLDRVMSIFLNNLDEGIRIGFHGHNNMQLSFSLAIQFARRMTEADRECILDSSLCGMGRGAGNATTELVASFLNRRYQGNYDMDSIMDAIDVFMVPFQEKYQWGYSTPTFIAGLYCSHVNNIDYLLKNHRTNAREMRSIIDSLDPEDRLKYDYDLLEEKYIQNQNRLIDDEDNMAFLRERFSGREILLIAPGKKSLEEKERIDKYINDRNAIIIAVNALLPDYKYDYLFLQSRVRYDYAKESYTEQFENTKRILLSNIKTKADDNEIIVRYERAIQRGYDYFDNAVICLLRLLDKLRTKTIAIAGFDRLGEKYNESYADPELPTIHGEQDWNKLNNSIKHIYRDFRKTTHDSVNVRFLTESVFATEWDVNDIKGRK